MSWLNIRIALLCSVLSVLVEFAFSGNAMFGIFITAPLTFTIILVICYILDRFGI